MKVNLATTHNINSSFSGLAAKGYLEAATLSGDSLASGAISIHDNVKGKEVIQVLSADANLIKPSTCDFSASGTLNTTEIVLEVKEFQVQMELCSKNYRSGWESIYMKGITSKMPQDLGQHMLEIAVKETAASLESNLWTGTATNGTMAFDGFETLAAADASVIDVAKSAITAQNVTSELQKGYNALPNTIFGKPDVYFYVPTAIYSAYIISLGGFASVGNANGTTGVDGKMNAGFRFGEDLYFGGIKLIHCPGMTATDYFIGKKENFIFGTSLYSELNNSASIIDMGPIDGSQNSRIVLRGSAACAVGIGAETVFYS
jgi:hypothetical protein|tara:strand:+ start:3281 stop:4234 length:954 start_codon:yes stop_codon:yes gene_type:complete